MLFGKIERTYFNASLAFCLFDKLLFVQLTLLVKTHDVCFYLVARRGSASVSDTFELTQKQMLTLIDYSV